MAGNSVCPFLVCNEHLENSMQLKETIQSYKVLISGLTNRALLLTLFAFLETALCMELKAQSPSFRNEEDSLRRLSRQIYTAKTDSSRLSANARFAGYLSQVLQKPGTYEWPFDSLPDIGCLRAPNNAFRIFNWNLQFENGTFRYFGYLVLPGRKSIPAKVISLKDRSDSIENPAKELLSPPNWYGALYYSILVNTWKKQTYYTLLAWDGYSAKTSRKIIDILTFDKEGKPQFGLPVFKTSDGTKTRVIIEYARSATFLLRFDKQYLVTAQKRDGSPVKKRMGMIVFDRLVPIDPRLKGRFEYYVPSGETYDAYIFNHGFWQLAEDVLVSNPSDKKKAKVNKPVEYNLFPPK